MNEEYTGKYDILIRVEGNNPIFDDEKWKEYLELVEYIRKKIKKLKHLKIWSLSYV